MLATCPVQCELGLGLAAVLKAEAMQLIDNGEWMVNNYNNHNNNVLTFSSLQGIQGFQKYLAVVNSLAQLLQLKGVNCADKD